MPTIAPMVRVRPVGRTSIAGRYVLRRPELQVAPTVDYDLALARIDAPIDPTVGDRNRATANGRIDVPGDVVLYRVPDGAAGDGVFAALEQAGGMPLIDAGLGIALWDKDFDYFQTVNGSESANRYRADPDPASGVLANAMGRLPEDQRQRAGRPVPGRGEGRQYDG
ncbi:MAG: hypothetical protein U5K73_11865 [Halofilum sp. (in: g-proteobacteria)]|nr:hypothetical protein [Halofilum sp. (in: g-proteobacteria)]